MALADLAPSAVAAYALDEASGNALDQVNSYDATETSGTIGTDTGKLGSARDFEAGDDEWFERASNSDFQTGDVAFAAFVWVKPESIGSGMTIFSKLDGSNGEYRLEIDGGGSIRWVVYGASGFGSSAAAVSDTTASAGNWFRIVVWHDPTANEIGIAVNDDSPTTTSITGGVYVGTGPFMIGSQNPFGQPFDGLIDELVFLKGVVPSAAEITEDYNGGTGVAFADWDAEGGGGNRRRRLLLTRAA